LIVNDIDDLYLGKEGEGVFNFYAPEGRSYAQNIDFYFSENTRDVLKIERITNNYAHKKSRKTKANVEIPKDVFLLEIKFVKEQKMYAYVHSDTMIAKG